jgi:hypothetical protein
MGKGKNSGAGSSKKIVKVDEDQVLMVIENKEFLAMRMQHLPGPFRPLRRSN